MRQAIARPSSNCAVQDALPRTQEPAKRMPPPCHAGHALPALASALARGNKCASIKDFSRPAVNQAVSHLAGKTIRLISQPADPYLQLIADRKAGTGIFARFFAGRPVWGQAADQTGLPSRPPYTLARTANKDAAGASCCSAHRLFPFKVFRPLAVNHLTAVSPMQP